MSKLTRYEFLSREKNLDGEWVYEHVATQMCDSDAQAELHVNHLRDDGKIPTDMDGKPRRGLTIRRGDAEWYSTGV